MELTIDTLKKEFADHQTAIEQRVKDLLASSSDEAKKQVTDLQGELAKVKGYVEQMETAMKQAKASSIPGFEKKDAQKFSFGALIGALYKSAFRNADGAHDPWKGAEFEQEVIKEYAKVRTNNASDGSAGGYLIPPEVTNEIIELAIAQTPILGLGTTIIRGLTGELPVPTITGRPTSYWVGENGKPTASQAAYGLKTLKPKKIGAFTRQSKRLAYQSRGVSDQIIRQLLAESIALKLHEGLVSGVGADFQPLGIMNQTGMTTSTVNLGTNGGRFRMDHGAAMQLDLDVANELAMPGTFNYLMRPEVLHGMKRERVKQYSEQAESAGMPVINPLMSDATLRDILGYGFGKSTQLSATETTGSSSTTSSVLFGNWTKFWVGMWRDLIINVSGVAGDGSTGSAFLEDQMYIVAFQEVDCLLMRPTAFTKVTGAECNQANW